MAPTDMLRQWKDYYYPKTEEDLPVISTRAAAGLSIAYTLLYVLPFYLSPTTRPSPTLSRDAPSVIRARIRFVTASCIISSILTLYIITKQTSTTSPLKALHLLGWYPLSALEILRIQLLTALLFLGPLFEKAIVESQWRSWIQGASIYESLSSWIGWRNYIAGPITEEIMFRSLLVPIHLLSPLSSSPVLLTFICPLYFGIAHIHHFYEFSLTHPYTPLFPALLRSLFQFAYTTLFGWYATFVFLRTGSLWSVVLAHAFCNWIGLPRFWGMVERNGGGGVVVEAGVPIGPPGLKEKQDDDDDATAKGRERERFSRAGNDGSGSGSRPGPSQSTGISWTIAYYILLVIGAVAFWMGLWPLTESKTGLVPF